MAGRIEKELLIKTRDRMIAEVEQERLVDETFRLIASLKELDGPHFLANLLLTFLVEARMAIRETTEILGQAEVNYTQIDFNGLKVYGGSLSLGALPLAQACNNLRDQAETKNKERCLQSFNLVKEEFGKVYDRFNAIAEVERRIADMEDGA